MGAVNSGCIGGMPGAGDAARSAGDSPRRAATTGATSSSSSSTSLSLSSSSMPLPSSSSSSRLRGDKPAAGTTATPPAPPAAVATKPIELPVAVWAVPAKHTGSVVRGVAGRSAVCTVMPSRRGRWAWALSRSSLRTPPQYWSGFLYVYLHSHTRRNRDHSPPCSTAAATRARHALLTQLESGADHAAHLGLLGSDIHGARDHDALEGVVGLHAGQSSRSSTVRSGAITGAGAGARVHGHAALVAAAFDPADLVANLARHLGTSAVWVGYRHRWANAAARTHKQAARTWTRSIRRWRARASARTRSVTPPPYWSKPTHHKQATTGVSGASGCVTASTTPEHSTPRRPRQHHLSPSHWSHSRGCGMNVFAAYLLAVVARGASPNAAGCSASPGRATIGNALVRSSGW